MSPLRSQILGASLAISTAIGCLAYEKTVMRFSVAMIALIPLLFRIPLVGFVWLTDRAALQNDWRTLVSDRSTWWPIIIFLASDITLPIWYTITRHQGLMVASIYEMKYLVILAVFYALFGDKPMSYNLVIGLGLAFASLWFVSRA